ncbi:MAG: TolC family protein [Muribaculaceae bacterium]|nr:TolC family protein [Muribaculaceae bacterium]
MIKKLVLCSLLSLAALSVTAQRFYSVDALVDSALNNNLATRAARHDLAAASEQRKEAFTKYFPSISASGGWFNANRGMVNMKVNPAEVIPEALIPTLQQALPSEALSALGAPITFSAMKNGVIGGVTAMQPVFAGGQIVNGNRLASLGEQVGELKLEVRENQVILTTEQYYWQLQAMQEKLRTLAAVETLLERLNSDVTAAVSAGVALRNDLLQVQLRQNEVLSNKLQLCNGIALLKMVLAQYCGLSDTAFVCATALPDVIDLPAKWNHSAALANTPEYRLLEKNVQASELQRRLEVGKHLPTVAVGAGFFYHNLLDNDKPYAMLMASVSIPISDWWGGSHAIKRKKIELQKANEQLIDNSQLLEIRMQQTWDELYVAYQQVDIARQSIAQADENLRISRDCYRAGTVTMSDLLQAQLLQQQAHDRLADAKADYRLKLIAYNQATGHRR